MAAVSRATFYLEGKSLTRMIGGPQVYEVAIYWQWMTDVVVAHELVAKGMVL